MSTWRSSPDAPPGSARGSSALVSAVVGRSPARAGMMMTADRLARLAYAIERDDLGIAGGWQDQYAAAFGGCNLLEFSAAGVAVTPVRADRAVMDRLRRNLLLCYTGGVRRNVGLIDAQISLYREGREETILGMKQLHEMAYAMRMPSRPASPIARRMLHDAFEAKQRMNPQIATGTPIEAMLAAAGSRRHRGKICGAGGGGYLMVTRARVRAPFAKRSSPRRPARVVRIPGRRRSGQPRRCAVAPRGAPRDDRVEAARPNPGATSPRPRTPSHACGTNASRTRCRRRHPHDACGGGKVLICGNGGSAADAQHLATSS